MTPALSFPLPGLPPILAPRAARDRIAILDILRGLAILSIFFINSTNMGNSVFEHFGDARLLGWSPADQACWWFLRIVIDGTQRGLLQFLFGAGALILLRPTFRPEGPVGVVDMYLRRNAWLALFGLFNVFGLLWFGDILFPYGIAALFLFPLRRLSGKVLLALALLYVGYTTVHAAGVYRVKAAAYSADRQAEAKQSLHQPLTPRDTQALAARAHALAALHTPAPALAEERAAHQGPLPVYAHWLISIWIEHVWATMPSYITAVFFSTVLGMALFKFGITQGERSPRFYAGLALACYLPGLALRIADAWLFTRFDALPNWPAVFTEPARLLVTLGHVALINLLVAGPLGRRLLAPLQAVGRVAFSCYLLQDLLGMWILFPAFGLGLWGRWGWFALTVLTVILSAAQILLANLWLRFFAVGPLEWLWRSLTYRQLQPLRHRARQPDPVLV